MRPLLTGQRVVVTRAADQAGPLVAAFEDAGAEVVLLPLIEVVVPDDEAPLERAAAEIGGYDWLLFTSANAAEAFLPRLAGKVPSVAVVGPATAGAVCRLGVELSIEARQADAEGLVKVLGPHLRGDERVLVPQADDARPVLVDCLRDLGLTVVPVVAYSKKVPADTPRRAREIFSASPLGRVTFTSPRIVREFAALFGPDWAKRRTELLAVSIGRVTSAELRRQGVGRHVEAKRPTPEAMVRALIDERLRTNA